MADRVAVIGAGITSLACARELRGAAAVTVVDRIPVPGGVHGWSAAETRELAAGCGAQLLLGETATRWDGDRLLVIGPDGPRRLECAALVVAAGVRPLGRAELGITGGRPAGVVAATVACHLAENGLPVGLRPLVLGGGDWAVRATAELLEAGARAATMICPDGPRRAPPAGVRVVAGERVASVLGGARVSGVELASGERLEGDALVLAHGLAALRNVDGAVFGGRRTVYAQPLDDPATVDAARAAGAQAAAAVRSLLDREERE